MPSSRTGTGDVAESDAVALLEGARPQVVHAGALQWHRPAPARFRA